MIIVFVLIAAAFSVVFFVQAYKLKKLKDRCTVKVKAICVDIKTKAVDFSRRNLHSHNAAYSFDYDGRNYIGQNSVWTSSGFSGIYVKKDDAVDLYINPGNPENDIFDPFAKRELQKNILTGIVILLAIIPLAFMNIIFHFVLFNR